MYSPLVFPARPIRPWVLSFPFQLRFLFATQPQLMTKVLSIMMMVSQPRRMGPRQTPL